MRFRAASVALGGVLLLLVAPASSLTAPSARVGNPPALPRVTLISDSVAGSISFDIGAEAILSQGVDLFLEPGEGRRLGGDYPPGAIAPPTALQLIATLGDELGPTVIMSVGYNDAFGQYQQNVDAAVAALHAAGVEHILWMTLHVTPDHTSYLAMNAAIEAAAAQDPALTVVDWNAYAGDHPEWFQGDGVHLTGDGPRAMAGLLHASLVGLGIPASQASS
jgi:hypothetical protein